jgi:hypothetical protein
MYLHMTFEIPSSDASIIAAVRLKAKNTFRVATILLSVKAVFWTLFVVCILIKLLSFGSWIFFRLQVK